MAGPIVRFHFNYYLTDGLSTLSAQKLSWPGNRNSWASRCLPSSWNGRNRQGISRGLMSATPLSSREQPTLSSRWRGLITTFTSTTNVSQKYDFTPLGLDLSARMKSKCLVDTVINVLVIVAISIFLIHHEFPRTSAGSCEDAASDSGGLENALGGGLLQVQKHTNSCLGWWIRVRVSIIDWRIGEVLGVSATDLSFLG